MKIIHSLLRNADPLAGGGGAAQPAGAAAVAAGGSPAAAAGGTAAAAPGPWTSDWVKPDGAINHAAFERLPDDLKPLAPSLANTKTAEDLLRKMVHLNSLAGRKGLAPLPADAKPEDVAAHQAVIRAVMGVPEKPEGYGFTRPEDLPEQAWNEENAKAAMALMHKHNVSPAAAKELLALQVNATKANIEAQVKYEQDFYAQQDQSFRQALTKSGDDYDKVMNVVNLTAQRFGMPADHPILKNADTRLMLQSIAKAIGEPVTVTGQGTDTGTKSERALAESIIHDKTNPEYAAYWDGQHPKNKEVKAKVMAMQEAAVTKERAAAQGGRR